MAKKFKNIIFTFVFAIIFVIFLDCLFGIFLIFFENKLKVQEGLPEVKLDIVAHPYKSYINKPETVYYGNKIVNEFGHLVSIENKNIAKKPKGHSEYRILFLGGSTTFQEWPFHLTDLLNTYGVKYHFEAINAGTGGYTSQENLIDLAICGFSYEPDLVIAYLPINDIFWSSMYPDFKRDYTHMRIPLKVIPSSAPSEPIYAPHRYPFILRLIDYLRFREKYIKFLGDIDLSSYETKTPIPWPNPPEYRGTDTSFVPTVDALIDNILDMKALCEAHHIQFLLVTQKLFPASFGYASSNKYADRIDELTLNAIEQIKASEKLKGLKILEMQPLFPNSWTNEFVQLVKKNFPHGNLNFSERMAYDDMHFNKTALYLFAILIYQYLLENKIVLL